MMSLLKLQRQNPEEYNNLHPIIGALHEEMCYIETLCHLLNAIGLLAPACAHLNQNMTTVLKVGNTHKARTVILVIYRVLLRIIVADTHCDGDLAKIEESIRTSRNEFLSMIWDVLMCLGGGVVS